MRTPDITVVKHSKKLQKYINNYDEDGSVLYPGLS